MQDVSYSYKYCGKQGFPNLANSKTFQFKFCQYLIKHQYVKIVKSKFNEKSNKNKHKINVVLKEIEKKTIKIVMMSVMWPLDICLLNLRIGTC